jgi:hypothetical protein
MNCQSFESTINDLARDQMMEAEARRRALAHAGACERCRARLADERALTAGLQKVAESREEAPARVEASLREAFEAWIAPHGQPVVGGAVPVWTHWLRWAAAAALILLVALLALTVTRSRSVETRDIPEQASREKQAQPPSTPASANPQPEPAPPTFAAVKASKPHTGVRRGGIRSGQRSGPRPEANAVGTDDSQTEIATEFIPLIHGGEVALPDGGHIMRVELPRSALVSFGLPMNMERAGQRIQADVVVGNDGLARAIRFVR